MVKTYLKCKCGAIAEVHEAEQSGWVTKPGRKFGSLIIRCPKCNKRREQK